MNKGESFERLLVNVENNILKEAVDRDSKDNISCIFICFKNLYDVFIEKNIEKIQNSINIIRNTVNEFDNLYDNLKDKDFFNENSLKIKEKENNKNKLDENFKKNKKKNNFLDYFCLCFGLSKKKKKN